VGQTAVTRSENKAEILWDRPPLREANKLCPQPIKDVGQTAATPSEQALSPTV